MSIKYVLLAAVMASMTSVAQAQNYGKNDFVYAKPFIVCASAVPESSLKVTVFASVYNPASPSNPSGPAVLGIDSRGGGSMTLLQVNLSWNEKTKQGEYVSFEIEGHKASKLVVKASGSDPTSPKLSGVWYQQEGENPLQMHCEVLIPPTP